MKKYIVHGCLFISLLLTSCGARKVNKSNTEEKTKEKETEVVKNNVVITDNIKIETTTKIDEAKKETVKETSYKPIDNSKPGTLKDSKGNEITLNNTEFVEREITRDISSKLETNTNTSSDSKTTNKTTATSQKEKQDKKNEKGKEIDKKEFSPFLFLSIVFGFCLLLAIIMYIIYRDRAYKNKNNVI